MEQRDFFTREVCSVSIEDGVATVTVRSGTMQINIDMRVSTLINNMAACDAAVAKWRVAQLDGKAANVSRLPARRAKPTH